MGEQIMLARKRRHLSMQDVADRATIASHGVEGALWRSTVSMGIYARVLFALNLENNIKLIASFRPFGKGSAGCKIIKVTPEPPKGVITTWRKYMYMPTLISLARRN